MLPFFGVTLSNKWYNHREKEGVFRLDTLGGLIVLASSIAFWVFLVMGIIGVVKKNGKGKKISNSWVCLSLHPFSA